MTYLDTTSIWVHFLRAFKSPQFLTSVIARNAKRFTIFHVFRTLGSQERSIFKEKLWNLVFCSWWLVAKVVDQDVVEDIESFYRFLRRSILMGIRMMPSSFLLLPDFVHHHPFNQIKEFYCFFWWPNERTYIRWLGAKPIVVEHQPWLTITMDFKADIDNERWFFTNLIFSLLNEATLCDENETWQLLLFTWLPSNFERARISRPHLTSSHSQQLPCTRIGVFTVPTCRISLGLQASSLKIDGCFWVPWKNSPRAHVYGTFSWHSHFF